MENPISGKNYWRQYLTFGGIAALCYLIACFLFIKSNRFSGGWVLYFGNALFMATILLYMLKLSRRKPNYERGVNAFTAGLYASGIGTAFSCIGILVLLIILAPGVFTNQPVPVANNQTLPPQMVGNKTGELLFMLYSNAILANFLMGAFISLVISYGAKQIDSGRYRGPRNTGKLADNKQT